MIDEKKIIEEIEISLRIIKSYEPEKDIKLVAYRRGVMNAYEAVLGAIREEAKRVDGETNGH